MIKKGDGVDGESHLRNESTRDKAILDWIPASANKLCSRLVNLIGDISGNASKLSTSLLSHAELLHTEVCPLSDSKGKLNPSSPI